MLIRQYSPRSSTWGRRWLGGDKDYKDATLIGEVFLDILDGLLHSESVTSNDGGWVDLLLHKFISILQQLCSDDHHTGGPVTNLLVLQGGQLHQDLGC